MIGRSPKSSLSTKENPILERIFGEFEKKGQLVVVLADGGLT